MKRRDKLPNVIEKNAKIRQIERNSLHTIWVHKSQTFGFWIDKFDLFYTIFLVLNFLAN